MGGRDGMANGSETVVELERRIAELRARLPKHSIPPAMLIELDDLEEALEQARVGAVPEEHEV